MELKQNPFSFYDFLGYLTPGAVLLYGLLFIAGHTNTGQNGLTFMVAQLSFAKAEIYIPFVLAAYIAGHFLSFISSITIERYSIWAHDYPSKYLLGIPRKQFFPEKDKIRKIVRFVTGVLLTPITVLDWILGERFGMRVLYAKSLDNYLIDVLRGKLTSLIADHLHVVPKTEDHGSPSDVDLFRFAYHYAVENAPNHVPKMQNYVALYGFLRTLTLISLLFYWGMWWHTLTGVVAISTGIFWMFGAALLTYLLFMAFVKFYRRFSLEALMAMAVCLKDEVVQPIPNNSAKGKLANRTASK
jgi:hypothetical protein